MTNYYQVLGVPDNATAEQIKTAYREYAKHFHPDKHSNNEFFKRRFQEVQHAYEILSDIISRANFERQFNKGGSSKFGNDSTIAELNAKIKKLDSELLHKETILKRTVLEAQKSAAEALENEKKVAALSLEISNLKDQFDKKVKRDANPPKARIFLNNLRFFLRPPISYALVAVIVIIEIGFFVKSLPDKRINLAKSFASYREHDDRKDYKFILNNSDSLFKSNGIIDESSDAVKWGARKLEMADLLVARGIAKARMRNDSGAMRDFTVSLKFYKKPNAYPFSHRGTFKIQLGDTTGGLEDIEKALMIDKSDIGSRNSRAEINYVRRKYRLALADYTVAHNEDSQDGDALNEMGRCYYSLNKPDSACIMWRKAVDLGSAASIDNVKNLCK